MSFSWRITAAMSVATVLPPIIMEEIMEYQEGPISPFNLRVLLSMGYDIFESPASSYDHMSDDLNLLDVEQDCVASRASKLFDDEEVKASVQMQQCWPLLTMKGPVGYTWHDKIGALHEGLDYLTREKGGYR